MKAWLKRLDWKNGLTVCGIIAGYAALMLITKIGCPSRWLFGVTCPGCGMSRACLSALLLDLPAAFAYHPLWPLALCIPVYAFAPKPVFRSGRRETLCLCIAAGLMVVTYGVRLLAGDPVVAIHLTDGILYRAVCRIFFGG